MKTTKQIFIERCFEIAFGEGAIDRDFDFDQVLLQLETFSNIAYECEENHHGN